MPLPICACPGRPQASPISTFQSPAGLEPWLIAHRPFADHRPGFHGGVDLVAGPIEETRIDEKHPRFNGTDAFLQIDRRAPLLIHEADLDGVARQRQHVLDGGEQIVGERDFVRAVHLRLDDVDRAGAAVAQ